jgi:hypothetical protein
MKNMLVAAVLMVSVTGPLNRHTQLEIKFREEEAKLKDLWDLCRVHWSVDLIVPKGD